MRTPPNERLRAEGRKGGAPVPRDGPERRCVLSGETAPRDTLIRLALSPDGEVLPDPLAKAPGRGAWIGVDRAGLECALADGRLNGAMARAFRGTRPNVAQNLPALIERALVRTLLDRLGLEMRAGKLILGSDRIAEQARSGRVVWIGHAADASEDGSRKLDQALRVGMDAQGSDLRGRRLPLDRAALSVALGRDNVVHLALADRASAERVMIPLKRLLHFTGAVRQAADDNSDRRARAEPGAETTN